MPKKPNAKQTKYRKIPGVSGYYAGSDGHIYSFRNSKYNQLTEFRHPYANFLSVYMLTGGK